MKKSALKKLMNTKNKNRKIYLYKIEAWMKITKKDLTNIKHLIESSVTAPGQIDDGPNVFFGTRKGYKNWAKKNGELIKFVVNKFYVNDVINDFKPEGQPEWGNNFNRTQDKEKKIMDKFVDMVGWTIYNYLITKKVAKDVTGDYVNNSNESNSYFNEIGFDKMIYERKL